VSALVHRVRPSTGPPEGAIVLLHGRGADEHDLFGLFDAIDPERRFAGVTARGPLRLPPGGNHWYVVERVGYPHHPTFRETWRMLQEFIDADVPELTGGAPIERTVIGGFSQGTVMSYALGLGKGRPSPAGILAVSGFIPKVDGWEPDLDGREGLPVWISHGSQDPVIPVEFGRQARDLVTAAALDVSYHETPVGHGVDPSLIGPMAQWLDGLASRLRA
jgi:phospholipase/carboxylesterase